MQVNCREVLRFQLEQKWLKYPQKILLNVPNGKSPIFAANLESSGLRRDNSLHSF